MFTFIYTASNTFEMVYLFQGKGLMTTHWLKDIRHRISVVQPPNGNINVPTTSGTSQKFNGSNKTIGTLGSIGTSQAFV